MFATARACTARPFAHTDGACRRPVPLPYMISTSLGNSHSETLQLPEDILSVPGVRPFASLTFKLDRVTYQYS